VIQQVLLLIVSSYLAVARAGCRLAVCCRQQTVLSCALLSVARLVAGGGQIQDFRAVLVSPDGSIPIAGACWQLISNSSRLSLTAVLPLSTRPAVTLQAAWCVGGYSSSLVRLC
jgi:hypothetical protein